MSSGSVEKEEEEEEEEEKKEGQKLIEAEKTETGVVKLSVVKNYFVAVTWAVTVAVFLFNVINLACSVGASLWLTKWSDAASTYGNTTMPRGERDMYLGVYGALGFGQALVTMLASITFAYGALRAATVLHSSMLQNIMKCPMAFFDTTPQGRILNRFSKDVDVLDTLLPSAIRSLLFTIFQAIGTIFVICYTTPEFLAAIVPLLIIYVLIQRVYVATSRQLKRLESVSRSPIYSHFGESIQGASSIRAYNLQEQFVRDSLQKVDTNHVCYYYSTIIANRWLAVRLEMFGNCIILLAAILAVANRSIIPPGLAGLSVSYAMGVTQMLNWLVRMSSELESNIVAVERMDEYAKEKTEAEWEIEDTKPAATWPENGKVVFNSYQTRYREGLDLVLKDISCNVEPGERVGIVGRTGAGKSSLTLSLFRLIEPAGGEIKIDDVNIATIGLHDLRKKLTIIPQDPVLFSGTMRLNLDPFNTYSSDDLWRALEHAHLKSFVKGLEMGLDHEVSEGGENLSVGQRQLVCLARALLRKTKILILDEATAAVDLDTDNLIQDTIRTQFKECTVLTIAHRLNTIIDYDKVMVLDKGLLAEFEPPGELLKNEKSIFYSMAKDANLVNK